MKNKFYITTPIYYVNDKPHIGHATTTIAADVVARLHRLIGDDTWFLTGTDEHGQKIADTAKSAGLEPQDFADQISAKFQLAWDRLEISHNDFIRTTEERHEKAVVKFLNALLASGKIYKGQYKGLYCVGHEAFIKESDLVDGLCPDHKTKPQELTEENWFFKLSDYTDILKNMIQDGDMVVEPEARKNEIMSFLSQGLEDIAISRPNVAWGIPLPFDQTHTIYVWVDALINYISAIGYESGDEKFKKYWPVDVHLMGKEIIRFHCLIWPALLLAIKEEPPKKIFAHGFFTVAGEKMSKTVGNVIDPNEWVDKYGADAVRYFLLREIPFGADGDVSEEKLKLRYKTDLGNVLGNLFSRLTNMIEKYTGGLLPDVEGPAQAEELQKAVELTADFKFYEALQKIWEVLSRVNQSIDQEKPWELAQGNDDNDRKKLHGLLTDWTATLYHVAKVLAPYMPDTAEKIRSALSAEKIVKAEPLFPRID